MEGVSGMTLTIQVTILGGGVGIGAQYSGDSTLGGGLGIGAQYTGDSILGGGVVIAPIW